VKTLKTYLDLSSAVRNHDSLILGTRKPFRPASSQTLSRWLKEVLSQSGIDTTKFSGHSTRHASTSKAHEKGISIDQIFKAAGWSKNSSVFGRHYLRPVLGPEGDFGHTVLS